MRRRIQDYPTVTHRDHEVVYREDTDLWHCEQFGISDAKLSAVKRKIDAQLKSERIVGVDALVYDNHSWNDRNDYKRVRVTVICDGKDKGWCWVVEKNGSRSKEAIRNVVPLSAEADLKTWIRMDREAKAAQKNANAFLDNIERHDVDSLMLQAREQVPSQSG